MDNSLQFRPYRSVVCCALFLFLLLSPPAIRAQQVSFNVFPLLGENVGNPTSLQFGPDGRLYVSQRNGVILIYTIGRTSTGGYEVTATETIKLVQNIKNHDDDGVLNTAITTRQVTGILVTGSSSNPIIYASSSDPREGGAGSATDTNLDTNSGTVSKLTRNGSTWTKVDLVRGLPRSEENHSVNGMVLDPNGTVMYLTVGGMTNAGAPSNNFAFITEYALAAAIISIDLSAVEAMPTQVDANGGAYKYDLPTLDDPTRPNVNGITDPAAPGYDGVDVRDPFGGDDGLNQAMIIPGGPVQIYSSGWRNAYDAAIMRTPGREGRMYAVDNGANGGWGGHPEGEGPGGTCTNAYNPLEPGSTTPGPNDGKVNNLDNLHFIPGPGYYAGHPAPTRGNPAAAGLYTYRDENNKAWRTSTTDPVYPLPANWPPVPVSMANPVECDFRNGGVNDGALYTWPASTNGIAEYAHDSFGGAMMGDLLAVSWDGVLHRIKLNTAGDAVVSVTPLASNFATRPLDVTTQATGEVFEGTIWVAAFGSNSIHVFEPDEGLTCTGTYTTDLDEDGDGYSNADEIDNSTDPCSSSSLPADFDGDLVSDLNDPDDDNDGLSDQADFFAIDANNGLTTTIPRYYPFFNDNPGTGFFGLGFTGLMSNGTDYLDLYDDDLLIAGGTAGLYTVDGVTAGDAKGSTNTQQNAFQFGINVSANTGTFTMRGRIKSPFFNGTTPVDFQTQGLFVGTGSQDDYLRISLAANGGNGGIEVLSEGSGTVLSQTMYANNQSGGQFIADNVLAATLLDLYLTIDPAARTVQPAYAINGGGIVPVGTPMALSGSLLNAVQSSATALAVGVIATSAGSGAPFTATWDEISIQPTNAPSVAWLYRVNAGGPTITDAELDWSLDTSTNPSPYLVAGGNKVNARSFNGTNNTDAPDVVFDTHRWDPAKGAEMHWAFPLAAPGTYEVRLYLAETFTGTQQEGARVFDVYVEGELVLDGYDIYKEAGINAVMKAFVVEVADGAMNVDLDVEFGHKVENPMINALAVRSLGGSTPLPSQLASSPTSVDFGQVSVGVQQSQPLTLSNTGSTDPIALTNLALSGSNNFALVSPPSLPISLQPGQSTQLTVAFTPDGAGARNASLSVTHDGQNSPLPVALSGEGTQTATGDVWEFVTSSTSPKKRHENAFVEQGGKFYLLGGRGSKPVNIYNPATNSWSTGATPPMQLHHFQALTYNGKIYVMGAYTGGSGTPEVAVPNIYTYDPATNTWAQGPQIPAARQRGSAGAVLYNGKIYLVGGSTGGHGAGSERKAWLDEYDPVTNTWVTLPDAPRARDHFHAVRINDKLYVVAGRNGTQTSTIAPVDVYDFGTTQWSTLPASANIPTQRAGAATVAVGNDIIVIGGESGQDLAHDQTEALDVTTNTWRTLDNLNTGRHGTQALVYNGHVYIAAGSATRGSGDELTSQEALSIADIPSQLAASPTSVDFGQVATSSQSTRSLTLSNTGTSEAITLSSLSFSGSSTFSLNSPPSLPTTLAAGQSMQLQLVFAPDASGARSATLSVAHDGANSPLTVALSGEGTQTTATTWLYRVNAGGNAITDAELAWSQDTSTNPSPYLVAGGNKTASRSFNGTNNTDAPDAVFQTHRWDPGTGTEMHWAFPLSGAGTYEVRLYLAETNAATQQVGARVFDVLVEGELVLNDYDLYAEAGKNAVVKAFVVEVSDGAMNVDLDVEFGHQVENPMINALAVRTLDGTQQSTVTAFATTDQARLAFADVALHLENGAGHPELVRVAPGKKTRTLHPERIDEAPSAVVFGAENWQEDAAVVIDLGKAKRPLRIKFTGLSEDAVFTVTEQRGGMDGTTYDVHEGSSLEIADGAVTALVLRRTETPPTTYSLEQNYPNPFNPVTTLRYQLPEAAQVQLTIYNVVGQLVQVLVDEKQETGRYEVTWTARDETGAPLSSGVYLYRLQAGSFIQTRKMLVLK